jgi:hypothetical protein
MHKLLALAAAALLACAPTFSSPPAAFPIAGVSDSLILEGLRQADLVVLGTPDAREPEPIIAPNTMFGRDQVWSDVRISVEDVAKGKLKAAKRMDYGNLPTWQTPRRPFALADSQVMVQESSAWRTAPVTVGERAVFFLRKCYNCVELPHRTEYRVQVSPWFSILTLTPDQWERVKAMQWWETSR